MSREKQIEFERNEIAEIIAQNFDLNHEEKWDASDFEWSAHCLQMAGFHKQEWISVDERLPENDYGKHWKERRYYIVMTEPCGLMRVAKFGYKDFPWWIDSHDTVLTSANYNKVTHWMPLPEAPKMKGGK